MCTAPVLSRARSLVALGCSALANVVGSGLLRIALPLAPVVPYLRAVLWSFLGIRQRESATAEQQRLRPLPLIATALALVVVFVLLLVALASSATAAEAVPDTLAQRALACTGCHGPQGRATPLGYLPRIAGKPAGYLAAQLRALRDGQRQQDAMARLLVHLGDDYLAELAGHFAALQLPYPAPAPTRGTEASRALGQRLVQQGDAARNIPACVGCHGTAMTGVEPAIPGLLGLPRDYLVAQLGAWRTGMRAAQKPDCMATLAQRLQPQDITAVADWLAAQPLPASTSAAPRPPSTWPMPCGSTAP